MKIILYRTISLFLLSTSLCMEGNGGFNISKASTHKFTGFDETNITKVIEFGDANGPYKYIAGVVVESSGLTFSAGGSTLHTGGDTNFSYHAKLYVNEMGKTFGVVGQQPIDRPDSLHESDSTDDNRPFEHIELCRAAVWAIQSENTKLLEALLQAGLSVNELLELDMGWTPLHYSAVHNSPRSAKVLLENGAFLDFRCKYGERPIDYAYEDGQTQMCEILRRPDVDDRMISSYPEQLLREVFSSDNSDGIRFLSINGEDPSDELLEYFRRFWPNVRPWSRANEINPGNIPKGEPKPETWYCDKKTKDYGFAAELTLKSVSDTTYSWSQRVAPTPFGSLAHGKVSNAYGYWIKHDWGCDDIF